MDNALKVLGSMTSNATNSMNNCMLCKIDSFDAVRMKANIIPLLRDKNGEDLQLLIEVPVMMLKAGPFIIRPPYNKGDIVIVVFADGDIENVLLSGDVSNRNSKREHSLDDAMILGGVMPFIEDMPSSNTNDLVIGKRDLSSSIILKEDGDIEIKASGDVNITGQNINLN